MTVIDLSEDLATEAQRAYLKALGFNGDTAPMTKAEAAAKIGELRSMPSQKQRDMLKRLKVNDSFVSRMSRETASLVIELLLADKQRRRDEKRSKSLSRESLRAAKSL